MIPPKAVSLLIDHFDSIDAAVSRRLIRNRPWSEVSLTSLLCDMLDETTQAEERLSYPLARLNADLAAGEGVLDFSFEIETHEYGPEVERYVTQSDLGLVVSYDDLITHDSWSTAWLLQAKRLSPNTGAGPQWTVHSRFGGRDTKQQGRMGELAELVGADFVKYLLFCPRPASLEATTAKTLAHLRTKRLSGHIFDHALGIKLHEELGKPDSSLAAGVYVADRRKPPGNLGQVHDAILQTCDPLSWFIARHFSPCPLRAPSMFGQRQVGNEDEDEADHDLPEGHALTEEWRHGVVTGDPMVVKRVLEELGKKRVAAFTGRFLPSHTMTIRMRAGHGLDPDLRTAPAS